MKILTRPFALSGLIHDTSECGTPTSTEFCSGLRISIYFCKFDAKKKKNWIGVFVDEQAIKPAGIKKHEAPQLQCTEPQTCSAGSGRIHGSIFT